MEIGVYDGAKRKNFKQFTTQRDDVAVRSAVFMMVQRILNHYVQKVKERFVAQSLQILVRMTK